MMLVSVGAIASIPIATTSLSSKIGRQLMPLLFDFQIPPAAEATKRVFDGLGMPCTAETRPMKLDGPTFRHRNVATMEESSICADTGAAKATAATPATTVSTRNRCMTSHWVDGGTKRQQYDTTITRAPTGVLGQGCGWRVEGGLRLRRQPHGCSF